MNEKVLIDCGLSLEQAKIYTYIITNGLSTAKVISSITGVGRALTYKILDQLEGFDLVEKREDISKIALFSPKHPRNLKNMIDEKKRGLEHAYNDFNKVYGLLSSEFNALIGRPNVQFYDGVEGISKVHEDILDVAQDIMVISSPIKEGRQEVLHLIKEQIEKQVAKNIKTKAIAPHLDGQKIATPIEEDEKYLITRKKVSIDKLNIPAQIILYGDKVSITNFKENIITVVIESRHITETFRVMFNYIWNHD